MNAFVIVASLLLLIGLGFSLFKFYKAKSYRVMLSFTVLGLILGYYFKGLTDAKLAGQGIGTEGMFVAFTVFVLMLFNGVIGQFLSITLKKPHAKNKKLAFSIGGIFIIVMIFMMLLRLL